jgi:hypothetical protein
MWWNGKVEQKKKEGVSCFHPVSCKWKQYLISIKVNENKI